MPPKARIFHLDDRKTNRTGLAELLKYSGHEVVLDAGSLPEGLAAVERFRDLKINVAVLDGDLHGNPEGGRTVLRKIREVAPDVKTVGLSSDPFPETDYDAGRYGDIAKLGDIITLL